MSEYELYHFGVKGMKWGVRKKDRYVSRFQAHRNATKAAKESRKSDIAKGVSSTSTIQRHASLAKAKSRLADMEYNQSLRDKKDAARQQRKAENTKVLKEKLKSAKTKVKKTLTDEKTINAVSKASKAASKLATYSIVDDVFYNGAGKKILKETAMATGRAAVTAFMMARGDYDIKWYDKYGRRVG